MSNAYISDDFIQYVISEYKSIKGEQETKNKLIEPFLSKLGYEIDCIEDIRTEVDCGMGIRSEKIDYILCIAGQPKILVEAKKWNADLSKQNVNQLYRYFCSTNCKLAILTNGIKYQFYSDFERENIMDEKPFYTLNLLAPSDKDNRILSAISKTSQCAYDVSKFIIELKTQRLIANKAELAKLISSCYFRSEDSYEAVLNGLKT